MANDYSGLFQSPEDIRTKRLDALQANQDRIRGMGGSMSGLLGQVAAGRGGMLAEGLAGMIGLKTAEEKKAEDQQNIMSSIEAPKGSAEWFNEAAARLQDINPEAALAMQERGIAMEQQTTDNAFRKSELEMQKERIGVSKEQVKIARLTHDMTKTKYDNEQSKRQAYETTALALTADPEGLKGLGINENIVEAITDGDEALRAAYVPMVADRLEEMATFTQTQKNPTAAIQNYTMLQELKKNGTPEEIAEFKASIRGGKTQDLGDRIAILDSFGNIVGYQEKGIAPEQTAQHKQDVKVAEQMGQAAVTYLTTDAPKALKAGEPMLATIDQTIDMIQNLDSTSEAALFGRMSVPADDPETGAPSDLWRLAPSQARQANSYLSQLRGQAFLQAFQMLKGGGQITNLEGSKAEASLNRLSNRLLFGSKEEVLTALNELKSGVVGSLNSTKAKMDEYNSITNPGGTQPEGDVAQPQGKVRVYNPDTGEFE